MIEKDLFVYLQISNFENVSILCKQECEIIKRILYFDDNGISYYDNSRRFKEIFPELYNERFEFIFKENRENLIKRLNYNLGFLDNVEFEYQKSVNNFILSITKYKNIDNQNNQPIYQLGFHNYSLEGIKPLSVNFKLKDFDVNKIKKIGNLYITDFDEFIQKTIDNYFENINYNIRNLFVYKIPKSELN